MPIYEFYCPDCHTIFSFLSAGVATDAHPLCPGCAKRELDRRPSTFATPKFSSDEEPTPFDHLDEAKLEGAMASLVREMGDLDEVEDPRKLGKAFRQFGELTGLELGPKMEEALARLEAGEDIDALEAEMGDGDADDESLEEFFSLRKAVGRRRRQPAVDDTLHFL